MTGQNYCDMMRISAENMNTKAFREHPEARQWAELILDFLCGCKAATATGYPLRCIFCPNDVGPHVDRAFDIVAVKPMDWSAGATAMVMAICEDCRDSPDADRRALAYVHKHAPNLHIVASPGARKQ